MLSIGCEKLERPDASVAASFTSPSETSNLKPKSTETNPQASQSPLPLASLVLVLFQFIYVSRRSIRCANTKQTAPRASSDRRKLVFPTSHLLDSPALCLFPPSKTSSCISFLLLQRFPPLRLPSPDFDLLPLAHPAGTLSHPTNLSHSLF